MASSILLKNATILVPSGDENHYVVALRHHSLLIEGNTISRISSEIAPPSPQTKILDCTGKIISPGFIDTHHHLWQTQLKGRYADRTLMEYMSTGPWQATHYTPEDIFWGQLGGCLEALDAGTTTVVDHAHMNISAAHSANAIEAIIASGIRSIFGYSPTMKLTAWKPELVPAYGMLADWVLKQFDDLATSAPWADGRVDLGLAFDGYFLPKDVVVGLHERARNAGVKLITAHCVHGYLSDASLVDLLDSYGLLGPDFLLSHATNLTEGDVEKIKNANAWTSSTPDTELQMGLGNPVCFRDGCTGISSLGVDCHSNNSSDIPTQMRMALQCERARRNDAAAAAPTAQGGKFLRSLDISVQDAFKLGTIQGARAIRMETKLGSIEVGKLADLVIFDGKTPGMLCAAEEDPIAAIVLHSSIRDIDTVIVDGQIRKQDGRLVPVDVDPTTLDEVSIAKQRIGWGDVAQQLLSSRRRVQAAIEEAGADDLEHLVSGTMKLFHIEESKFV
ncbi:Metallo-dependent hydrolase [Aspergillus varians]